MLNPGLIKYVIGEVIEMRKRVYYLKRIEHYPKEKSIGYETIHL